MTPDRALMMARDEILDFLGELCACGLEDRYEALRKLEGIEEAVKGLRARVEQIADERAEHPREHVPGPDMGWVR